MPQLVNEYVFEVASQTLTILPSKLVWWPEKQALIFADSHFGKASFFRSKGIPVPAGTTSRMLATITEQTSRLGAKTIIVLGDFTHSKFRSSKDFEQELLQWRTSCEVELILCKGNHDLMPASFYSQLNIRTADKEFLSACPLELCHDPVSATGEKFSLCGHLHPATKVGGLKLPAFWLRKNQLVLPAFGLFTGTAAIALGAQEKALAICEDQLAILEVVR